MERVMLERGDMIAMHEPFIYLYYVHDGKKELDYFDVDPQHPTSYEAIKSNILSTAQTSTVFVKDMCYYVSDYIFDDIDFLKRITSTYLIRDPARSIPSYYKLDPELTLEEVGLESQYRQFSFTWALTGECPIVVDAQDLVEDTEAIMRLYCQRLGIPFLEHSLNWSGELPEAWRYVAGWHQDLSSSGGIKSTPSVSIDVESDQHLLALYQHHLPYYKKLTQHRLRL